MFVTMDVTFFELTPFSTTNLQGGGGIEDLDQLEYLDLRESSSI